ncbi:MAG: hypothetical protein ACI4RB_03820, partial [Acutalibacteraceae bacterium]
GELMATLHLKKSIKLKSLSSTRDRNVKSDSQYKNALHYKKQTLSFANRINQWKEEWISPFYNNINIEKYYNAKHSRQYVLICDFFAFSIHQPATSR